jgi:hypothetical protein
VVVVVVVVVVAAADTSWRPQVTQEGATVMKLSLGEVTAALSKLTGIRCV